MELTSIKSNLKKEIELDLIKIISSLSKEKQQKFLVRIKSEAAYERTLEDLENMRIEELMKLLNAINHRLQNLANLNNEENKQTILLSKSVTPLSLSSLEETKIRNNVDEMNKELSSLHFTKKIIIESSATTELDLHKVPKKGVEYKQLLIIMELFDCSKNEHDIIKEHISGAFETEKCDIYICSEFLTDNEKSLFENKIFDLCIYVNLNVQFNFHNCIKGTKEIKYFSDVHLENLKNNYNAEQFIYLIVCPRNIWSLHHRQKINSMRREILPLQTPYLEENNIDLLSNNIKLLFNNSQ